MFSLKKTTSLWLIAIPNIALFFISLWLTIQWRYPDGLTDTQLRNHDINFSVVYLLWLLTFWSFHLFERESFRRYTTLVFRLFSAMFINLLLAIGYFYFQPQLILTPRRFLLVDVFISFVLVLIWDLVLKSLVFNRFRQPVYLSSLDEEFRLLADEVQNHQYLGFKLMGRIDEVEFKNNSFKSGSIIVFPDNLQANKILTDTIFSLRGKGVTFSNHSNFYEQLLRRIYLPNLDQIWFLHNVPYKSKRFHDLVKTIFDYLIGVIIIIFFIITFPLVALLIKISSRGPVFFIQERVGLFGRVFKMYKYRTMAVDHATNTWTSINDPRITSIGKFLRKTRLDELPQSINLLLGHMSIVGPRPEQEGIVDQLKKEIPFYEERHVVKPGLSGWGQLNVYANSIEESRLKLQYDLYYIKNRSVFFDLEIIIKTIYHIFSAAGK